jgi:hypothetical protein
MNLLDITSNGQKITQAMFLLPLVSLVYLKSNFWIILIFIMVLGILESYYFYLNTQTKSFTEKRIEKIKQNKPLMRNWKDLISDAKNEFSGYLPAWWLFGILELIFICFFIFSAYTSFVLMGDIAFSELLFLAHIFMISYQISTALISNFLLNKEAKK